MMWKALRFTIVGALLCPSISSAQVSTMDFSSIMHTNYDALAQSFGDRAGLNVSNAVRTGLGNSAFGACDGPDVSSHLDLWNTGYSDLSAAAFACRDGLIGEISFAPTAGKQVTLQSLRIGSYQSTNGIGPARGINLQVYNSSFVSVFSFVGTITSGVNLFPNITSSSTLYLQWGADWDTGLNLITTNVTDIPTQPPTSTVPEPSSVLLMAAGLGAIAFVSRKRKLVA